MIIKNRKDLRTLPKVIILTTDSIIENEDLLIKELKKRKICDGQPLIEKL